jgi:uncharacterized surface protein with fasciclin (FAS1) repeats
MKTLLLLFTAVALAGANMDAKKDILENATGSKDHSTFVAAVKAAGLEETLKGSGPFTVFAPTNAAFAKLPAGTVDKLLKPENKEMLAKILTYHVVPGTVTVPMLKKQIKQGSGSGTLKTVSGDTLTFTMAGGTLKVKDERGTVATVTLANVMQSNGVIQVVDTVLMPN